MLLNPKMSCSNIEVIMLFLILYAIIITAVLLVIVAYFDKRIQSLNHIINNLSSNDDNKNKLKGD